MCHRVCGDDMINADGPGARDRERLSCDRIANVTTPTEPESPQHG